MNKVWNTGISSSVVTSKISKKNENKPCVILRMLTTHLKIVSHQPTKDGMATKTRLKDWKKLKKNLTFLKIFCNLLSLCTVI